jgi:hypothetical protein
MFSTGWWQARLFSGDDQHFIVFGRQGILPAEAPSFAP